MSELPALIKRCLVFGVKILPFELDYILRSYDKYKIPDEDLNKLNKEYLEYYVKALYLSSCEMAREWTEGHNRLASIGFTRVERKDGHRCFVSLVYGEDSNIKLEQGVNK